MSNLTELQTNATSHKSLSVIIKVCVVIPFFCVFLCCIAVMLHIFASHRQFLDTSRYILFASMLVNDTLQLMTSVLLFLFVMGRVKFGLVYCVPLLFLSTATFHNTTFILATMSLERYIAIVYPLRRPASWRSDRIWIIILSLWFISCIFPVIDFSIGKRDPSVDVLSTTVHCKPSLLTASPIQKLFKAAVSLLFFAVVAVIILFTYVRILLETRKLRQDRVSVNKAVHTVLLHGFQLLLSVLAFSHPITESLIVLHAIWQPEDIAFFNYFSFILIPRFLSPLIYGFRDQSLRGYIGKTFLCCSKKVKPWLWVKADLTCEEDLEAGEMYTSLLNVRQAISVERKLIDDLRTYIDHEFERLQDIRR
ncbi:odorant receptor 131-2-like [Hippoglossus hippoglossus]|uniref:odorant receptor 131-2-like n=1 Tax=Hippoglossus hippoglossus TaxID=8267 RepID=UPI00148C440D|nr:odorant receptor 131-2-like [Hippoglossus hippoglossus]